MKKRVCIKRRCRYCLRVIGGLANLDKHEVACKKRKGEASK